MLPPFLKHIKLSAGQRKLLDKPMKNWMTAGKHIRDKGLNVQLVEKMLAYEFSREEVRENMVEKLLSRYNAARRNAIVAQVKLNLSKRKVKRIKPRVAQ